MKDPMPNPATRSSTVVWAALVLFTIVSFALGGEHFIDDRNLAAGVVIGIGAIKIRLVGLHFMELRHAPSALRAAFEAYCVLLFALLTGICILS